MDKSTLLNILECNLDKVGGAWLFRGTRVPVSAPLAAFVIDSRVCHLLRRFSDSDFAVGGFRISLFNFEFALI